MNNAENTPVTTVNLAQFIASVPAMLGMIPNNSLVIAGLTLTGQIGAIARVDHDTAAAIHAVDMLKKEAQADAVYIALVSAHPNGDTAEESLLAATKRAHALGLEVPIATVLSEYAAGEFFFDFPSATAAHLADPHTSAIAAARVVAGSVPIAASRDALVDELAPVDDTATLLDRQFEARRTRAETPQIADTENLDAYRAAVTDHRALTPTEAIALAVTLAENPRARDVALYFSTPNGADAILTDAARHTSGYARFAVLSVLATVAYAHGHGPRAVVALEAIEAEVAHETQIPKLALLMRAAVDNAMHPDRVHTVLDAGRKVLPEFGFTDED